METTVRHELVGAPIKVKRTLRLKKHEIEKYNIFVKVLFKMFDEDTRIIDTSDDTIIKAIIQLSAELKDMKYISQIGKFQNEIIACAERLNYVCENIHDDLDSLLDYDFHKNGWYNNSYIYTNYAEDIEIFETIVSYVVDPAHIGTTEITLFDGDEETTEVVKFGKTEDGIPFVRIMY